MTVPLWGLARVSVAILLGAALLSACGATAVVGFRPARVAGQAMAPAVRDGDRVIVNRLVYAFAEPQIGDIVMHQYPKRPDRAFIMRVIAVGGDRVQIVRGQVFRNGRRADDSVVAPESRSHEDWGPHVVPDRHLFVMGDRRNDSSDSRHWGFVRREYVLGRVRLRWWPNPSRVK